MERSEAANDSGMRPRNVGILVLLSLFIGILIGTRQPQIISVHLKAINAYEDEIGNFLENGNDQYRICTTVHTSKKTPAAYCFVDVSYIK